jgi:chemotaxis protein MotB
MQPEISSCGIIRVYERKYRMKKTTLFALLLLTAFSFSACNKSKVEGLEQQVSEKDKQIQQLEDQVKHLQFTNASLLDRMSDLSIVSKEGATSIRESLENINQQYQFIEDLTTKLQQKDSLNLALVMNLKRSLSDMNDEDVKVEVRGGVVHVSISDQLLFRSGSSKITDRANEVLAKVATVVSDHQDLNLMVEGHTDDIPIANSCVKDNWDLSVKRATAVVRVLEEEHYVDPARMIAAGRADKLPKADNDTEAGRSLNRRTEIVIMPRLDQFFQLMEPPVVAN